jgi:hypothetical protein
MGTLTDVEQTLAYRFAHVALPPDATDCESWRWRGGEWRRFFLVREWDIGGIWVSVAGEQNHRGHVRRWMHVGGEDECTSSDRRRLIGALEEAGRLLDALTATDVAPIAARRI